MATRIFALLLVVGMTAVLALAQTPTLDAAPSATAAPAPTSQPTASQPAATQPAATRSDVSFWQLLTSGEGEFSIQHALRPEYWVQFLQDAIAWTLGFIPRLLSAMLLLLIFWFIYRMVRKILVSGMKAAGVDESIRDMLGMLLKWSILGFGLIIAGNQIGIQIAALLTGVSIIGLAIGFASQETIGNFIAGIMIFWDKPFEVGDWIQIDGHLGQVKRVTFRSTRMQDMDGDIVVYPNMKMLSEKVVNKSANAVTRCNVAVGIAYKESIERARGVMLQLVAADGRIEKNPEPEVVVKNLGASSVDLVLHFWIKEERYEDAMQYEYMERVKVALDQAGIEIPFPHTQVVMESVPRIEFAEDGKAQAA
ncbi:MAG: mechanosensitive ion channel family protein [Burkholderiales bacterium]|nr:mechanosensitive ion channel family protein [Phycisphaerae bacterium]